MLISQCGWLLLPLQYTPENQLINVLMTICFFNNVCFLADLAVILYTETHQHRDNFAVVSQNIVFLYIFLN